jgi:hypothetical protein
MKFILKNSKVITGSLWILAVLLIYLNVSAISAPIEFNKVKKERYLKVIDRLKDIRNAQIAFKSVKGVYSNNFDSLINFVENAEYTLIQKRDSSFLEYDRTYRIDMLREVVVVDTLGFASVKDSLFGNSNRYKNMAEVPIDRPDGVSFFAIKSDIIKKGDYNVPVFEVSVSKDIVLWDQNKDLLKQEKGLMSVDGVNGPSLVLGSMIEVNTNGIGQQPMMQSLETKIEPSTNLLIKLGYNIIDLILSDSTGIVIQYVQKEFSEKLSPEKLLKKLDLIINESVINISSVIGVKLIVLNKLSTLVPRNLFDENLSLDYLKFNSKLLK